MGCCGPKMAMVGIVLSLWAIVQLTVMGILYFVRSVILLSDVIEATYYDDPQKFYKDADREFKEAANRCWFTAGLYVLLLIFSLFKHRTNKVKAQRKKAQKAMTSRKSVIAMPSK